MLHVCMLSVLTDTCVAALIMQTLEAEADQETEETAQHATAGSKKSRQRQHSQHGAGQQQAAAAAAMNGVAHVKAEDTAAADEASDSEAVGQQAAAAVEAAPAAKGKAQKKAVAAASGQEAVVAEAAGAAPAAVVPAPAAAAAPACRAIKTPLQRLQRPVRGADEGEGAAAGQALGAADIACWSVIREPVATSKQPTQQQRGTKRKRSTKASTPPPDATTEIGTEDGEDAAGHVSIPAQQAAGKPLPAGTRPSWLVQALQGGSAALNKRQVKGLADDLSQPQQVEFMLGCVNCDYQQVGPWVLLEVHVWTVSCALVLIVGRMHLCLMLPLQVYFWSNISVAAGHVDCCCLCPHTMLWG